MEISDEYAQMIEERLHALQNSLESEWWNQDNHCDDIRREAEEACSFRREFCAKARLPFDEDYSLPPAAK